MNLSRTGVVCGGDEHDRLAGASDERRGGKLPVSSVVSTAGKLVDRGPRLLPVGDLGAVGVNDAPPPPSSTTTRVGSPVATTRVRRVATGPVS